MSTPIILVAIDFSQSSHAALAWAVAQARGKEVALHLVHVVEELPGLPAARRRAEADTKALFDSCVTTGLAAVTPHVRYGHPVRSILAIARDLGAELLVVGSHGHTGLERVLVGSVAERLVRLADCPVVVVKAPLRAP